MKYIVLMIILVISSIFVHETIHIVRAMSDPNITSVRMELTDHYILSFATITTMDYSYSKEYERFKWLREIEGYSWQSIFIILSVAYCLRKEGDVGG